jgi:signal transduction histidine kinase
MLIHSHGSSGKPREMDLNTLLSEAVNLTCHSMRSKDRYFDIKIETAYDPNIEPIRVIPQDISRVIVNLINNAYHATSKKKEISENSYVPAFSIQTQDKADQVEIRVWDNGIGISDHMKSEIFNPFFSTKPSGEGAGLGLSISYDIIVRGHQGTIDVDSEEGQYSEFLIRLPKKSEK